MTKRWRVVVTDYLVEAAPELDVLGDLADIVLLAARTEEEVFGRTPDADALIVFHDMRLTEASLGKLTRCRGVVRAGVGYDNVSLAAAGRHGIVVCNVPDYGTEEVADHSFMMLLAIVRRLPEASTSVRSGVWNPEIVYGAPRLRGRTFGLIGCGRIGTATALRAKAFGCRVVFYDPYKPPGYEKALGVDRAYQLEELLSQSDFLSVHTPLTDETWHILGKESLSLVRRGVYLVNTARGGCIDLDALWEALEDGRVARAALDVVEREPLDDERFRSDPRVLLTPHAAFYSVEAFHEMRTKAAQEVRRMLVDEPVRNPVNVAHLTHPRCRLPNVPPTA